MQSQVPVLDQVVSHLPEAVENVCVDEGQEAFGVREINAMESKGSACRCRVEGANGVSFPVRIKLSSLDDQTCNLRVEVQDGNAHRFTCRVPNVETDAENLDRAARGIALFLWDEVEQRRESQPRLQTLPSDPPPHVPMLRLDDEGTIQSITERGRQVLEYSEGKSIDPNFFSHVRGQNLRRVMRDLAQMVTQAKQRAQWLVRLRTGNHRWRWYRLVVENHLDQTDGSIRVLVRRLGQGSL